MYVNVPFTITAKSISVQSVASVTAARVRANVVVAVLGTPVTSLETFVDIYQRICS